MDNFITNLKDRKNFITILVIVILLVAIPLSLYLIRQQQIFKGRAFGSPPMEFLGSGVTEGNPPNTTSQIVQLKLTYGTVPNSTPTPTPRPGSTPTPTPTPTPGPISSALPTGSFTAPAIPPPNVNAINLGSAVSFTASGTAASGKTVRDITIYRSRDLSGIARATQVATQTCTTATCSITGNWMTSQADYFGNVPNSATYGYTDWYVFLEITDSDNKTCFKGNLNQPFCDRSAANGSLRVVRILGPRVGE